VRICIEGSTRAEITATCKHASAITPRHQRRALDPRRSRQPRWVPVRPVTSVSLVLQPEGVCPSVRDANRGSAMSSTSRPSAPTGTPPASGQFLRFYSNALKHVHIETSSRGQRWLCCHDERMKQSVHDVMVTGRKMNRPFVCNSSLSLSLY